MSNKLIDDSPDPIKRMSGKDCQRELHRLQTMYRETAKPYIDRLVEIEMQKKPGPFIGEDGKVYEYIGPWPVEDIR